VKPRTACSRLNKLGKPFTSDSRAGFLDTLADGLTSLKVSDGHVRVPHPRTRQSAHLDDGQNVGAAELHSGAYEARELAMTRMQDEATRLSATASWAFASKKSHQWVRTPSCPLTRHRRLEDLGRGHLAKPKTIITLDSNEPPSDLPKRRSAGSKCRARVLLRGSACRTSRRAWRLGLSPWGRARILPMQQGVYSMMGLLEASRPTEDPRRLRTDYQCPHGMIAGEHRMWGQNYNKRGSKVRGTKASRVRTRACLRSD